MNVNSILIKHDCEETGYKEAYGTILKTVVMRHLSWWPPSSRSWDSNEGRTVRGRKEGGELSLSQAGRTRLPAFSLHLPNCQGPQAWPSQGSRAATSTATTTQPHRLVPGRACKSTLSPGKPICFCCPEARAVASTPSSQSPYLSLSFPRQTSRHRLRSPSKFLCKSGLL